MSLSGSIATVYEDIMFKASQPTKETLTEFYGKAKGNSYVITTGLFDQNKNSRITSSPTIKDHYYLSMSPIKSKMLGYTSSSNSGKPTNIDAYLEILQGPPQITTQESSNESLSKNESDFLH